MRLLLVLDAHIEETVLSEMFGQLQEKVMWLAERPYLAEGMPLKILTLLSTLLQVLYVCSLSRPPAFYTTSACPELQSSCCRHASRQHDVACN